MLNESPERARKEGLPITPARAFFRNVWECFRRSLTPFLMYFFMSLLMLACQAFGNLTLKVVVGIVCILGGAFFNGHLLYLCGGRHYGELVTGEARRRGLPPGAREVRAHHPEREYRPWKGFAIGLFVGLPVLILGTLSGALYDRLGGDIAGNTGASISQLLLVMLAGWAIIPITWFGSNVDAEGNVIGLKVSPFFSLLFILLPILVSGVFYMAGALIERKRRLETQERMERVKEAQQKAREAKKQEQSVRVQTEEQRKKTLQSKKKK